jgi:steroid delta-isomerase-like uncharacterized protein
MTYVMCGGSETPMPTDGNIEKTRRFMEEAFNKGNWNAIDEYIAAGFVEHDPLPGQGPGPAGLKQAFAGLRQAFPDLRFDVDDIFEGGDKVVIRSTMKGTNKGSFMNMPSTGKAVNVKAIDIVRMSGGKAVEHWGLIDTLTLMQQLGAVPAQ